MNSTILVSEQAAAESCTDASSVKAAISWLRTIRRPIQKTFDPVINKALEHIISSKSDDKESLRDFEAAARHIFVIEALRNGFVDTSQVNKRLREQHNINVPVNLSDLFEKKPEIAEFVIRSYLSSIRRPAPGLHELATDRSSQYLKPHQLQKYLEKLFEDAEKEYFGQDENPDDPESNDSTCNRPSRKTGTYACWMAFKDYAGSIDPSVNCIKGFGTKTNGFGGTALQQTRPGYEIQTPGDLVKINLLPDTTPTDKLPRVLESGKLDVAFDSLGFPEVVYLFFSIPGSKNKGCTGTLISNNWVITAAHCLFQDKKTSTPLKPTVYAHEKKIPDLQKSQHNAFSKTAKTYVHKSFWNLYKNDDVNATKFDIALLELESPLNVTSKTIIGSTDHKDFLATLSGFGRNQIDKLTPDNRLDVGWFRVRAFDGVVSWGPFVRETENTMSAPCTADSGAPIFLNRTYDEKTNMIKDAPETRSQGYGFERRQIIALVSNAIHECSEYTIGDGPILADHLAWICNVSKTCK